MINMNFFSEHCLFKHVYVSLLRVLLNLLKNRKARAYSDVNIKWPYMYLF